MSECVREMTLQEKAESIINLINHKDINAEYLYNWQIDAMKDMCEKQIPKKPIRVSNNRTDGCPECKTEYYEKFKYCPECGIKLDWSVEE